ncbi:MAG: GntR family transcriptional regulator [Planctomycetota bacterium]|nr:GntR family transcriptional regulator [Planctomycetota bacterium]
MDSLPVGLTEPLDWTSDVPAYEQIKNRITFAIARGAFGPNDQLPSVRALARGLVVNPNTVIRVYRELEQGGLLYTRKGVGVFVVPHATRRCRRERDAIVEDRLREAIDLARRAAMDDDELEALLRRLLTEGRA